jgi:hypothetical protein
LPSDYTFTAGDAGMHTFSGTVPFSQDGTFHLWAAGRANKNLNGEERGIVVTG